MKQICSDCHYIGEVEKGRNFSYKFPIAGFIIGGSVNLLISSFIEEVSSSEFYAFIVVSIVGLVTGIYILRTELSNLKTKPKIQIAKSSLVFLILGMLLAIWGISAFFGTLSNSKPIDLLGSTIWILFGILSMYFYYVDSIVCPKCGERRKMLPIDYPKAKSIIKENKLSVPE